LFTAHENIAQRDIFFHEYLKGGFLRAEKGFLFSVALVLNHLPVKAKQTDKRGEGADEGQRYKGRPGLLTGPTCIS
jgi:hypothetical protein